MNLMEGRFFTVSRIFASLISFSLSALSFLAIGRLIGFLLEESDLVFTLTFLTVGMLPILIITGVASLVFFAVRISLGQYYLDEEAERSFIYGLIEIPLWFTVAIIVFAFLLG